MVPYQLGICKRLSQCLHPNLPGGVHLKVLSVYKAIFSRIGTRGLASNLLVYSSGLFPLVGYASMSVRPTLLDICEQYYLPLGKGLIPALHGLVLGLLPGLEDESEHTERYVPFCWVTEGNLVPRPLPYLSCVSYRICQLLDRLCAATDQSAFFCALWQCVLGSPGSRLQAINFIISKLNKKLTVEDQPHCLGGNLLMVVNELIQNLDSTPLPPTHPNYIILSPSCISSLPYCHFPAKLRSFTEDVWSHCLVYSHPIWPVAFSGLGRQTSANTHFIAWCKSDEHLCKSVGRVFTLPTYSVSYCTFEEENLHKFQGFAAIHESFFCETPIHKGFLPLKFPAMISSSLWFNGY